MFVISSLTIFEVHTSLSLCLYLSSVTLVTCHLPLTCHLSRLTCHLSFAVFPTQPQPSFTIYHFTMHQSPFTSDLAPSVYHLPSFRQTPFPHRACVVPHPSGFLCVTVSVVVIRVPMWKDGISHNCAHAAQNYIATRQVELRKRVCDRQ